jgi:glycosyltransferase involved in cell wall biosynthesis
VVLAVRRLVHRMGLGDLVEAWWLAGLGDYGGQLLIVGTGPERAGLERRVAELGLSDSVRLLGAVPDNLLVEAYRAADVCAVPSAELEGFGLVVLESLACGTPVVATDVGGLPEVLDELQPDLVVPPARPDLLGARLLDAARGSRPLPGPEVCRTFAERHSWDLVAERHERLYAAVAGAPDRRLSVVYVDHCAQLSGAELALLRLLGALPDVDAHVVLGEDGPLVDRMRAAGVSVEVLPMAARARLLRRDAVRVSAAAVPAALASTAYLARLTRRLRELRPDLVHTNSLKAALYGGLAGRAARVPVVWHVHDRISEDYLPRTAVRLVRGAARWLPDAVVANSAATRATLGPAAASAHVVWSPVDLTPATRVHSGQFTVGVVGRLAPWKGQDVFLRAFAEAFPAGPARAVLVGAALFGEEDYAKDLRRMAERLGIADRVEFRCFREDVAAELARLDVLVHSSVVPEPFGQVVVEGMAAGLPVVAAAGGGPAEVVRDEVDGLLYRPGDAGALAAALRRLAADDALRARLAAAGLAGADRFRPGVAAERIRAVYRDVVASRHRDGGPR